MTVLPKFEETAAWTDAAGLPDLADRLRRLAGEAEFIKAWPWLRRYGQAWRPMLRELRFTTPDCAEPLLALWLAAPVEEAVDREWSASPGNAFLLDRLAAELCMAELRRRLSGQVPGPGQGQEGTRRACAPLPPATPGLLAALREAGLVAGDADGRAPALAPALTRRYAVLTYGRARGCEACALRACCPKLCE